MSLTPQDLQAIGDLIDQKLEEKLDQKLEAKLAPIRKDIRKIKKTLDDTIAFFDRKIIDHSRRLDRLEDHVGLPEFVHLD